MHPFEQELTAAKNAALEAGKAVHNLAGDLQVEYKSNNEGPVSAGDYLADRIILEVLNKSFPNDTFITEESYQKNTLIPSTGRVWFIDPIDGTTYYIDKDTDYAVMIGLVVDSVPVLGVVYQPPFEAMWYAVDTRKLPNVTNCTFAKKEMPGYDTSFLSLHERDFATKKPIAVVSKRRTSRFSDFLTQALGIEQVVKKGSVGLKLAHIAEGKADFYITSSKHMKLWDTAGPSVILSAAGGYLSDLFGQPLDFSRNIEHQVELCAASANCFDWLAQKLPQAIENWKNNKNKLVSS